MENNKYFTPDIEDIHVGYECEINQEKINPNMGWTPYIVGEGYENITYSRALNEAKYGKGIRVHYLTKEQIEDEEWKFIKKHPGTQCCDFEKYGYYLSVNFDFKGKIHLRIYDGEYENEFNYFSGHCRDINTFRKIIKLLEI